MAALSRRELPAAPWLGTGRFLRRHSANLGAHLNRLSYLRRWIILGVTIGAIAGLGAITFYSALSMATHLLLGTIGGWRPPAPAGEGGGLASGHFTRPWAIPLVAGGGALVAGLLVFSIAPEAEGHGTDAAIHAVHHNPRGIRFRAVIVKLVASAITIGSGGSGGREGPTGQISAGFGSLLARLLDLSPADARIAVSTGIGSGIGAIFRAPLGGAVLASEIVYREDVDPTVVVPAFVASIVAYAIFSGVEGFVPVFGVTAYTFKSPYQLGWFALLGVVCGIVGLLYAKGFYGIAGLFSRLSLPRGLRPALGGLLVGLIGLMIPETLGTGYGYVQRVLTAHGLLGLPLWTVLVVPFVRIIATGLSIGSGGSGGIFGPGLVIGAFLGAAFWRVFHGVLPALGDHPAPYVIIAMMACFGSIARAPLAVMLMVAEMTGNLSVLGPAMVAVGIATLIVSRGDDTIYRSQPRNRSEITAARNAPIPLLTTLPVRNAMGTVRCTLGAGDDVATARRRLSEQAVRGAPLLDDEQRFAGTIEGFRLNGANGEDPAARYADATAQTLRGDATLEVGLDALATSVAGWVTVVDDERRVIGTLSLSDVNTAYRAALRLEVAVGEVMLSESA